MQIMKGTGLYDGCTSVASSVDRRPDCIWAGGAGTEWTTVDGRELGVLVIDTARRL